MSPAWHIARRDLHAAFTTPLAWLVIACWTLLTNFLFYRQLDIYHGTVGAPEPLYLMPLSIGMIFLTLLSPALTMNSFAAERSQGTMQLLLTVPVREWHLVLGKFIASFALLACLALTTVAQIVILYFVSEIHIPQLLAGYCGFLLLAGFLSALGVWISLLVESPVVAYVLTFAAVAILYLVGLGSDSPVLSVVSRAIGLFGRWTPFLAGEVALANVLWFLACIIAFLAMAHAALTARRIHG
jgi:ABC-2 type transport system permease protein